MIEERELGQVVNVVVDRVRQFAVLEDDGGQWMDIHDALQDLTARTVHDTSVSALVRIGVLVLGVRDLQLVEQHLRHLCGTRQLELALGQLERFLLEHGDLILRAVSVPYYARMTGLRTKIKSR